jgi:hypothetical protein
MRPAPLLLLLILGSTVHLSAQDTLHIISHDRATIVTDPSKGVRQFPANVAFPSAATEVRQVLLNVTFGCPDSLRCADWDYLDRILVHRIGTADTFEVARMLTPYGGGFSKQWHYTWSTDLTDLRSLLQDSCTVIYEHGGYEPNTDRGWAVTLDFAFILGKPARPVLAVEPLYAGSFAYGDKSRSIEADLPPRTLAIPEGANELRIRILQTGHGMNADDGCGEFCAKQRYVLVDGDTVNTRKLWKDCGCNPVQPQAGTWIFDRANWCPGSLNQPDLIDVQLAPATNGTRHTTLDIGMEPYSVDSSTAVENICAYAILLGPPAAPNDVELQSLLDPHADQPFAATRPLANTARVRITNRGGQVLHNLTFQYGTKGFKARTFRWSGALPTDASAEVELPGVIDMVPGINTFSVEAKKPNGKPDAWPKDNRMELHFAAPPVLGQDLIVQLRTNKEPGQNALTLTGTDGRKWLDHALGSLRADTLYHDSLHLPPGRYTLQLTDTAGDGLEFWYNTAGGRGTLRLLDGQGRCIKAFESDCGDGAGYSFLVQEGAASPIDTVPVIGLFPARTTGRTVLDYFANDTLPITVRIVDEQHKQVVEEHHYTALKQGAFTYDLGYRPPQRYTVKVLVNGREVFSRRLRVVARE